MNGSELLSQATGIIGVAIGIAGLIYAVYQGRENKKLKNYNRSQAWYIYQKANNVTGIIQHTAHAYKESHTPPHDNKVIELLSKSDAYGQELFKETIRQIQLAEPEFNEKSIDRWVSAGKLDPDHKNLFVQIAINDGKA
jgi:hypothetical protein